MNTMTVEIILNITDGVENSEDNREDDVASCREDREEG